MPTSLDVMTFKKTIEEYVKAINMPAEVKRLVLKEIYDEVKTEALTEALAQAKEMEDNNANI